LDKIVLLRTNDRSRSTDSNVPHGLFSSETIVFNHVGANKNASATQTSLAVHSQSARFALGDVKKVVEDWLRWTCAVGEVEVMMSYPVSSESGRLIHLLVKKYH